MAKGISMFQNFQTFSEGDLIHLLPSHASFLHMGTGKFLQGYGC